MISMTGILRKNTRGRYLLIRPTGKILPIVPPVEVIKIISGSRVYVKGEMQGRKMIVSDIGLLPQKKLLASKNYAA